MTATAGARRPGQVETTEYDAFTRRILRAYGRRIAAGDIEALASLAALAAEVDAALRVGVTGLRQADPPYTWSDIAARLGVSKQAAQSRFAGLDRRLTVPGLAITVTDLVDVFITHHPGRPASPTCPGCGFTYVAGVSDCPSAAVARPLLYRRRAEDKPAIARLSPVQLADLRGPTTRTPGVDAARRAALTAPGPDRTPSLLDLIKGEDPTS